MTWSYVGGTTYSASATVATIFGDTVTIVGAGTTTIRANQSGDGNYNAATVFTFQ